MSERHPLEDLTFTVSEDESGNVVRVGDHVCGNTTPSRRGDFIHRQGVAAANASNPEDVAGYDARMSTSDGQVVREEMAWLVDEGLVSEEDAHKLRTDHRFFNENADALYSKLVEAEQDRPRRERLAELREQVREEDELTGGRRSSRRMALELKIAELHGGGR
jgi:hypothetical protein